MRAARRDDEFTAFVVARSTQLYRSAYLLTSSAAAAEDLVQTALTKTYVAWGRVAAAHDPVAYVHGILVKTFLSERRRRSGHELPVEVVPAGATSTDPSERAALAEAMAALSPTDRAVVVLRFWEDRTVSQTAHQLGLSEAAVKNRSLRALRRLRALLITPVDETNGA